MPLWSPARWTFAASTVLSHLLPPKRQTSPSEGAPMTTSEHVDRAAHLIANGALEAGKRVADLDHEGRCVTIDIYALGLDASRRHKVNPVRAITASIDLLWGVRD